MNYEHIKLLLDIFHLSIDIPHTDKIRAEIMKELIEINTPVVEELSTEEPELAFGARNL